MAALAGCAARAPVSSTSPAPSATQCPSALSSLVPSASTSWLFVRPAAVFDDPRLGPLLMRTFDVSGERALVRRAERTGFDVRTLDRAVGAWSSDGAVFFGAGSLDAARIANLLWDRLLNPRRRGGELVTDGERVEGMLGDTLVAALFIPRCSVAAFGQGGMARSVDRIASATADGADPPFLLVWHARQLPSELGTEANAALLRQVESLEVQIARTPDGLDVTVRLEGPLQPEAQSRVDAALSALRTAPIGELSGAQEWLAPSRVSYRRSAGELSLSATVPWSALSALSDALRGTAGTAIQD